MLIRNQELGIRNQIWNVTKNKIKKTVIAVMNPAREKASAAIACNFTWRPESCRPVVFRQMQNAHLTGLLSISRGL
jgi:hypothetical protein